MSEGSLPELKWVTMSRLEQLTGLGRKTLLRLVTQPHLRHYSKRLGLRIVYDAVGFMEDDFVKKFISLKKS